MGRGTAVDETAEFARLLEGLRAGDPVSAEELCRRYAPFIQAAVRRRLHPRLRTRFDSLDFVQDVWASFLGVPSSRHVFDSPEALLAFFNRVAYNKVVEVFRQRFGTQRDDITREQPVDDPDEGRDLLRSPAATPSQW